MDVDRLVVNNSLVAFLGILVTEREMRQNVALILVGERDFTKI